MPRWLLLRKGIQYSPDLLRLLVGICRYVFVGRVHCYLLLLTTRVLGWRGHCLGRGIGNDALRRQIKAQSLTRFSKAPSSRWTVGDTPLLVSLSRVTLSYRNPQQVLTGKTTEHIRITAEEFTSVHYQDALPSEVPGANGQKIILPILRTTTTAYRHSK